MVAAVLLAWSNSFSGAFVYDDVPAVFRNPSIHRLWSAFSTGRTDLTVSGRPLGNFSLALNYALNGTDVAGYHVLNFLIHLLAGAALFGIVRRTLLRPALRDRYGPAAPWLALTVAVLWLVHPLQTESVTYVIQRVESLMGLCYLLTLYCFIRGAESPRPAPWHIVAVAACLGGMASKEVMVSAPLMVLLYDRTFFAGSFREALRRRATLYAGLAATWLPLIYWVLATSGRGGSAGFGGPVTWSEYALLQCPAIVHYLRLAFWPGPLVFDYGILPATSVAHVAPYAAFLCLLVALTLIAVWRKSPVGILGAWFWMILAPSSSFVPVGTETMAEHRMYLPLIAVIVLTVLVLFRLLGERGLLPFLAVLAVGLGGVTAQRNNDYRTEFGLWSDTAKKRPDNARAHNNLGSLWLARGNLAEAERCFATALQLQPLYASAHYNLGIELQRTGRAAGAIGHFLSALRLEGDFVDAQVNVGNAFLQLARPAEAVAHYEVALHLQPGSPDLHFNLGLALEQLNRSDEAIREYQEALRLQPDFAAAQKALTAAMAHRPPAGVPPGPAASPPLLDLAANEAEHGDTAAAERHYREAIRLQPGQAAAHFGLGNLLAQSNRFSEAIEEYQQALQAEPDNLQVRNNLGNALLMAERVDEAIAQYEQILRLRPDDPGATGNLRQARALKEPSRRVP